MNLLKRSLAPITDKAWEEIDERATAVLKANLSGRKALKVTGPLGLTKTCVSEGRLAELEEVDGVCSGIYQVKPLVESRVEFSLNKWELDNVERGAADIDLDPLDAAAKKIAMYEEKALFKGLLEAGITGLMEGSGLEKSKLGDSAEEIMKQLTHGLIELKDHYAGGPFVLIVSEDEYEKIAAISDGVPLIDRIEKLLGHEIVVNQIIEGALLLPLAHEDIEFTIGQDFSIGYAGDDGEKVTLFIMESFTMRILDPKIIKVYSV